MTSGPLTALASGVDGLNGVYVYGASSAFPTQSYQATNYWVDVVFMPTTTTTFTITGALTPGASGSGATVTLSGTASATATADASGNYSFPGLANGSYTVTPSKTGFTFTPSS